MGKALTFEGKHRSVRSLEAPFPVIKVEGDPYSCGVQHGEKAKELVRRNVEYYVGL
jgi:hypothetical protein